MTPITKQLPPEGITVNTAIIDATGKRNEAELVRQGRLWFTPDMKVYVYYTPTHWSYV